MEKEELIEEFKELARTADESELRVLSEIVSGLQNKKKKNRYSYISNLLQLDKQVVLDSTTLSMSMPITPLVHNELNITHGGVIATLIDSAMGTLASSTAEEGYAVVTTDIQVRYVKPAIGKQLTCTCNLIHKGSKTIILEGKVFRDDGLLCAVSTGSFFFVKKN